MTQITTLNQLIDYFHDFSKSHQILKDSGFGQVSEIGRSRDMKYPYMWTTFDTPSRVQVANRRNIIPIFRFVFLFVDQVNNQVNLSHHNGFDTTNQQHVLSDTHQLAMDFINYLTRHSSLMLDDQSITIQPVIEETKDKVSGWRVDLDIKLLHFNCNLPL